MLSTNGHGPKRAVLGPSSTPASPPTSKPAPATPWPSSLRPCGSTPPVKATRS